MTTITLQLSPELEQKLRESIARRDAQSIRQLLVDAFAPTVEALLEQTLTQFNDNELKDEDELEASIDGLLDKLASYVGSIPTLSDYAVSREGIYKAASVAVIYVDTNFLLRFVDRNSPLNPIVISILYEAALNKASRMKS